MRAKRPTTAACGAARPAASGRTGGEAAFTAIELMAVLAMLIVLLALHFPVAAKESARTTQVQCASNLRQLALALHLYANEQNDQLPGAIFTSWASDFPASATAALARFGAQRSIFFCPAAPDQNADSRWDFASTFRVIGYASSFSAGVSETNRNRTLTPQRIREPSGVFSVPLASERVLMADVTISDGRNEADRAANRYTRIVGGSGIFHRASHLAGNLPAGGNVAMLDGHVKWKNFALMRVRTTSSVPAFWW